MYSSSLAPIALFAYNRRDEFRQTLEALQQNHLASQSELHVFVDGPKQPADWEKVEKVQQIAKTISGFRSVHLHLSEFNKGCSNSIIDGVSQLLSQHSSVIVVEDDIITAPNFLDFVNQGLAQYGHDEKVFSVGGYTFPFRRPKDYPNDIYFYGRTCAWGWGIWADRWFQTDWSVADFDAFVADPVEQKKFNYYGSDRVRMLSRVMKSEIDSWDIRLCYNQFKQHSLTIYPVLSKTKNIGFNGKDGTNTNNYNRYKTVLDLGQQRQFSFPQIVSENSYYTEQLRRQFSLGVRLLNRMKTYIFMGK